MLGKTDLVPSFEAQREKSTTRASYCSVFDECWLSSGLADPRRPRRQLSNAGDSFPNGCAAGTRSITCDTDVQRRLEHEFILPLRRPIKVTDRPGAYRWSHLHGPSQ
jgi:hypothetical protein